MVLNARYLNSITDTSKCSWTLEPLQVLPARINGSYFTSSNLSCAYHQFPLINEAQKLTSFNVEGRQYNYQVGFYGLKPLSKFFTKLMRYAFGPLIKKKQSLTQTTLCCRVKIKIKYLIQFEKTYLKDAPMFQKRRTFS